MIENSFRQSIKWVLSQTNRELPPNLEMFQNYVITFMMDDFHPILSQDSDEFPYTEIFNYLKDLYSDRIDIIYQNKVRRRD